MHSDKRRHKKTIFQTKSNQDFETLGIDFDDLVFDKFNPFQKTAAINSQRGIFQKKNFSFADRVDGYRVR